MSKLSKLCCLLLILLGCSIHNEGIKTPEPTAPAIHLPPKNDVWIFVMAGQSNMAGRAKIETQDLVRNNRILTINKEDEIVIAKEPLHFYEPSGAGLDCGIAFGTELLRQIPDDISILLIPTAVGGSSIKQWIDDQMHREVRLLSNFSQRLKAAQAYGVLKGILWHQGEADAHKEENLQAYPENLKTLFNKLRKIAFNESLPIVVGKLGSFASNQGSWDRINASIEAYTLSDENCGLVETSDLEDKGDKIHFNSDAQRALGRRFAEAMLNFIN